jgi:hypothetical protein
LYVKGPLGTPRDVGPIHEPMEQYSELVRDTLAGAGIRFAQVERTYSERGELRPGSGGGHGRLPPHKARWLPIRLRGTYSQLATGNCASNAYSICLPWER